jgi:hypothetical protein
MRVVMPPDFTHPRAARLAAWMLIGMVAVQVQAGGVGGHTSRGAVGLAAGRELPGWASAGHTLA